MNIFEYILVTDWSKNPHPNRLIMGYCCILVGPNVTLEPSDLTGGQEITRPIDAAHSLVDLPSESFPVWTYPRPFRLAIALKYAAWVRTRGPLKTCRYSTIY